MKTQYPPEITPDEANILDQLANGQTLVKACESVGITTGAFMQRLPSKTSLAVAFAHARDAGAEVMADSLLSIPDEVADVNRARLKADNIKWILARRHAGKYGDRIDVNVNAQVDLTSAIAEARNRLRSVCDQPGDIIDVTPINTGLPAPGSIDKITAAETIAPETLIPDFLK